MFAKIEKRPRVRQCRRGAPRIVDAGEPLLPNWGRSSHEWGYGSADRFDYNAGQHDADVDFRLNAKHGALRDHDGKVTHRPDPKALSSMPPSSYRTVPRRTVRIGQPFSRQPS